MNNGYLKATHVAEALHAAAAVLNRKGPLCEALDAAASAITTMAARDASITAEASGQVRRSDKAIGDVVIGSVCNHDWQLRDQESYQRQCRKCGERHEEDCPALLGGKCTCEAPKGSES